MEVISSLDEVVGLLLSHRWDAECQKGRGCPHICSSIDPSSHEWFDSIFHDSLHLFSNILQIKEGWKVLFPSLHWNRRTKPNLNHPCFPVYWLQNNRTNTTSMHFRMFYNIIKKLFGEKYIFHAPYFCNTSNMNGSRRLPYGTFPYWDIFQIYVHLNSYCSQDFHEDF